MGKMTLYLMLNLLVGVSAMAQSSFKTINFLKSIEGRYIVSGQHNDQKDGTNENHYTNRVNQITGKYPALYGGDFLFHGDANLRWNITYEAERQWNRGAIVNLMWHACPPVQGNVCNWDGGLLSSLSASQWTQLLTDGTSLNNTWKARMDDICVYLQYLENKGVEVLWRPLHEQNQTAFWWNSGGPNNTKALWRLTHNYMKNVKGLSNLIWVWDVQDLSTNFGDYNPGDAYFDMAAIDIYADGYTNLNYYNALNAQSPSKPIAFGECFQLPSATAIQNQPRMSFFMCWAYGLEKDWNNVPTNSVSYIQQVYSNPRVLTLDEMPGWNPNVPSNLATGKPITASSTEAGMNVASNANDGYYSSRWSSAYSDNQWISVDLGSRYNINRVQLTWEAAYGRDYRIETSNDGTNWTTLQSVSNNTTLTNNFTNLSGSGRYVRIFGLTRATAYGFSLYEIEIYGTPAATNAAPNVSITGPASGSSYTAPASITINANATDSDGSVSKVDFFSGTTLLSSDNTAPYSFTWNNVNAGSYSITAVATDNLGATRTSSAINISVQNANPSNAPKVVAYVANWNNLNTFSQNIDYSKLTHINIAFENPNSNGDLSFNSGDAALIQRAHAANVKVYVSIGGGGASTDYNTQSTYFSLISDSRRAGFVSKIASYLQTYNFDGIDVDLEGPAINGDYGKFIADLAAAVKPMGKGLTAALSQGYGGGNVPNSTFAHFDFINIMAYDATGPWDPSNPGQHSSYAFAQSNLQYWLNRGLPRNKAVLGVPFYGYGFGSASGEWSYNSVVSTYPGAENVDQAGSTIWYNGIPTMKAKVNYAFDQQIGGVMIWELSQDAAGSKSLLLAIDQVVKARSMPVPANLATGKPVTVSSTEAGANVAANAVDGQYGTRWSSLYSDAQWLTVDLGANYDINRVKISWEAAYGRDYRITGSIDGTNWFTYKTITGNTTLTNDHTGMSGVCRYISINATARGTAWGYSVYELEVYGTAVNNVNQNPTVAITSPANNSSFTSGSNIVINATASDADGSVSRVDFYQGTTLLGSDATSPYSFTWNAVNAGTYALSARAIDNANATGTSASVQITVQNVVSNQAPSVSITSPASNSSYNAPASITISANASDADGSISKVDFFQGTTLIGSDNTSPYSITWSNVASGNYVVTAKATDNQGLVSTSGAINITVNTASVCGNVPTYKENNGYVSGSVVQNNGARYECKPFPFSGWCNGAAWAYGPGTGSYWQDAWVRLGSCTSKYGADPSADIESTLDNVTYAPNPFETTTKISVHIPEEGEVKLELIDKTGKILYQFINGQSTSGDYSFDYDGTSLVADVYLVRLMYNGQVKTKKLIKIN